MEKNNLKLNKEKCVFFSECVDFLGYTVSQGHVDMRKSKVASIQAWPVPRNVKELQEFLGLCNFYRRFIEGFAKITAPLLNLLKKNVTFLMAEEPMAAFIALKNAFEKFPSLHMFIQDAETFLETDASDFAIGAVLSQKQNGFMVPISFYSRKLSDAERNYTVHDKELLAIIDAFSHWRHYLMGTCSPFTVFTDHRNLIYFTSSRELSRRQARWSETLAGFNFNLIYRPGAQNGRADALSRRPDYFTEEYVKVSKPVLSIKGLDEVLYRPEYLPVPCLSAATINVSSVENFIPLITQSFEKVSIEIVAK